MAGRARGGLLGRVLQEVETRSGMSMVSNDRLAILEQATTDLRSTWRELDLLGYTALDYLNSNPKELRPETRRVQAQKALVAWMHDPQLARAVNLLNDFTFGRGVPQPRAKDKKVQDILDEFWNDRDNKILLTSHEGQMAMGTDLSLQSNLFFLIFDDGRDGKIKVGLLNHDSVDDAVRDDNHRLRVLYYVAREQKAKWDYTRDRAVADTESLARPTLRYYEHYANVKSLEDDDEQFDKPPPEKMGEGRVYHIAVNRTTEMVFGVPEFQRVLRWASAYNDFMAARVDMTKAAAAFIMKRKIKGTPNQLAKMATRAISQQSPLAGWQDPSYATGGRAASIINENDLVSHEALKLDTGAGQAQQDGTMLLGQVASGVGFPKHYLGDADATLATATAMELFVIKMVESRQEVFRGLYRTLCDMVIEKAIDDGRLDRTADPADAEPVDRGLLDPYVTEAVDALVAEGLIPDDDDARERADAALRSKLVEAIEDEADSEAQTERDLTYEFAMPSPLRRQMGDYVTAITSLMQSLDPNGTNVELSRTFLALAFAEAFEIEDPADYVERIFPPGFKSDFEKMQEQQMAAQAPPDDGSGGNIFGPGAQGRPVPSADSGGRSVGAGGNGVSADVGAGTSYGAPMRATPPERVRTQQARTLAVRDRNGDVVWLQETPRAMRPDEDEALTTQVRGHTDGLDSLFDSVVGRVAMEELNALSVGASTNGNHEKGD